MTIINDVYRYGEGLAKLSDDEFYGRYPELKDIDNGEGWFSVSGNRTVSMSEFVEFGRRVYCQDSSDCAAEALTAILKGRGDSFARYYIQQLSPDVARYYLNNGGAQFYENRLSKSFEKIVFESPFANTEMCDVVNKVKVNAKDNTVNVQVAVEGCSDPTSCRVSCTTIDVGFDADNKELTIGKSGYVNGIKEWTRMSDPYEFNRNYDRAVTSVLEAAWQISELGGYDQEALAVFASYEYLYLKGRTY